jgi:hypothetical protein
MDETTKNQLLLNEISQLGHALQYVNEFYSNIVNLLNETDVSDDDTDELVEEEDEVDKLTEAELLDLKENGVINGFVGSLSYLNKK